jgi:hypothetical protein
MAKTKKFPKFSTVLEKEPSFTIVRKSKVAKRRPPKKANKKANKFVEEMKNYKNIPQRNAFIKAVYRMNKKSNAADLFTKYVIPADDLIDAVNKKNLKPLAALVKEKTQFIHTYERTQHKGKITDVHKPPMFVNLELEEGVFTEWFVVKKSTIEGDAGNGLFAARDFAENETVGIYLGQQLPQPRENATYTIESNNFGFVDAVSTVMNHDNFPKYMGLHMCNDPTLNLTNREELKKQGEKINLVVYHDLLVVAKKEIRKGDELFLHYKGSYYSYNLLP